MAWLQHSKTEHGAPIPRNRLVRRLVVWFRRGLRHLHLRLPAHIPIAYKLTLVFSLLIAGGMTLLGGLVVNNQTQVLEGQIATFGETLVQRAAESALEPLLADDILTLELLTNGLIEDEAILGAAIYSQEREMVTGAGVVPPAGRFGASEVADALEQNTRLEWRTGVEGESQMLTAFLTPIRYKDVDVGYAALTFDRSVLHRAESETLLAVVGITLLVLALGVAASVYLAGRLSRPIDQLMEATRAIAQGKYDYRFTDRRNDELGVLMETMNSMSEGLLRKEQVEEVFSRYVSPQVAKQALSDLEQVDLGGRHTEASVLFADIVGFTSFSEERSPEEVSQLLNDYFTRIARVVDFCGGHIDKYMGDCAMAVFGVPESYDDHPFRAAACAWMILDLVERLNAQRERKGEEPIRFRVGVNSGTMLAGNMGATNRMEYTVVGDAVNLASRLSHAGDPGQAVLTEDMLALPAVAGRVLTERNGEIELRGKKEPVATFFLLDIDDPFREEMCEENRRIVEMPEPEAA